MKKILLAGLLSLLVVSAYINRHTVENHLRGVPAYKWELVTDTAPFAPRDGAGLVSHRGYLFMFGGWNTAWSPATTNEVWRSPDGKEWERLPDAPWERRHSHGYLVFNDKIWVLGGDVLAGRYQSGVWSSPDGIQWTREGDLPHGKDGRILFMSFVHDGYMWIAGGQTLDEYVPEFEGTRKPVFYSDVWRSKDGRDWEMVSDQNSWAPRGMTIGSASLDGRMHIIGGGTYATGEFPRSYSNDHWSSKDGERWEVETSRARWQPRQYQNTFAFDGRLWVVGGWHGENLAETWTTCGQTWCLIDTPWPARHAAAIAEHKGEIFMLGGPLAESAVWRLSVKF